jgi:hypothetical protein
MLQLSGTIKSMPPRKTPTRSFAAKFTTPQGTVTTFSGTFTTAMAAFTAQATLSYSSDSDLVGTHSFGGAVGAGTFTLTMDGGATITSQITSGQNLLSVEFGGSGFFAVSLSSRLRNLPGVSASMRAIRRVRFRNVIPQRTAGLRADRGQKTAD